MDICITKTKLKDSDSGSIMPEEWRAYVDSDPSMIWVEDAIVQGKTFNTGGLDMPKKRIALWFSNIENEIADLIFDHGADFRIVFGYGNNKEYMMKICEVAEALGGFVQADDDSILGKSDFI